MTAELSGIHKCSSIARLLTLYACEEAGAQEREIVEQHVGACLECAAALSAELRLRQMLATLAQPGDELDPTGALLEQCRSELAEALDDSSDHVVAARLGFGPHGLMARFFGWCRLELTLHPAMGAALFVLLGLGMGRALPAVSGNSTTQAGLVPINMTVSAAPRISEQDLQNMSVSAIYQVPDGGAGAPNIEVQMRAMKPVVLAGGPDDTDVKRVLAFIIQNGQRFDSDVRMDSVEVLRVRTTDSDVRQLLCTASRHDPNPGVRLKALEALHGFEQDAMVRDTLLDALVHDVNLGVRSQAVDELRATFESGNTAGDPHVARVLRDLSEHDPNNYIRLQAAAAVRQASAGPLR